MNKSVFLKKTILISALSLTAFTFTACGGNKAVVGAWETDDGHTLVFEENGHISGTGMTTGTANYKVNGNTVTVYLEQDGTKIEMKGNISGDALVCSNENGIISTMYKK